MIVLMKTAISSYSFSRLMNEQKETQLSIIGKAKELGFAAIEFTDLTPPENVTESEYASQLKAEAERCGIEIACYSVGADLLGGCGGDLEAEINRIKRKVDIAERLGAKLLRHDAMFAFPDHSRGYQGFSNVLPRLVKGCLAVTEYAAQKGIRTMVENHGQFCQDSCRVEQLVNTVAHPNFGLLVDVGNFLCADEDPVTAVGRCAPYAFHVHIKDFLYKSGQEDDPGEGFFSTRGGAFLRGTVAGHGIVPIRQCIRALKNAGYDGYLALEFEGQEEIGYALRAGAAAVAKLI